jgi:hypothetical protein
VLGDSGGFRTFDVCFERSHLPNHVHPLQERKYFTSGNYALTFHKAGLGSVFGVSSICSQHPLPGNIPHLTSTAPSTGSNGGNNGTMDLWY